MNICETFLSIEGEGKRTGLPCVFVRRSQCNLRCSYCDSAYAFKDNPNGYFRPDNVVRNVVKTAKGCRSVTFTGGEPLYCRNDWETAEVEELLNGLTYSGFEVNVETNGSIDLAPWAPIVRQNGFFTMDWKSVSSGMSNRMLTSNVKVLTSRDVIKFVVGTNGDLNQMKDVITDLKPRAQVYVSPVFGKIDSKDIVEYILSNKIYNAKFQLQVHKYVWDPDARGV